MEAYQVDEMVPGIPDITLMTNHELDIAMAYYRMGMEAGRSQGFDEGYMRAEADLAAVQRQAVAAARAATDGPTYAQLAALRGEPERAERARRDEHRIMDAPPVGHPPQPPQQLAAAPGPDAPGNAPSSRVPVAMEVEALNRIRRVQAAAGQPDLHPRAHRTSVRHTTINDDVPRFQVIPVTIPGPEDKEKPAPKLDPVQQERIHRAQKAAGEPSLTPVTTTSTPVNRPTRSGTQTATKSTLW